MVVSTTSSRTGKRISVRVAPESVPRCGFGKAASVSGAPSPSAVSERGLPAVAGEFRCRPSAMLSPRASSSRRRSAGWAITSTRNSTAVRQPCPGAWRFSTGGIPRALSTSTRSMASRPVRWRLSCIRRSSTNCCGTCWFSYSCCTSTVATGSVTAGCSRSMWPRIASAGSGLNSCVTTPQPTSPVSASTCSRRCSSSLELWCTCCWRRRVVRIRRPCGVTRQRWIPRLRTWPMSWWPPPRAAASWPR